MIGKPKNKINLGNVGVYVGICHLSVRALATKAWKRRSLNVCDSEREILVYRLEVVKEHGRGCRMRVVNFVAPGVRTGA